MRRFGPSGAASSEAMGRPYRPPCRMGRPRPAWGSKEPDAAGSTTPWPRQLPDSHRDLLDGQFATLATVGGDGYPQLSEVWFLAEGDRIAISLNT